MASKSSFWYYVPMINVMYDFLFDETPSMAQINDVMNVFGLLNGLMMAVAAGVMNIFGPGAALAAEQLGDSITEVDRFYKDFKMCSIFGFHCIGSAVLMLILMFLFMGNSSFTNAKGEDSERARTAWWHVTRWLVLFMMLMTGTGMTFTVLAVNHAFRLQHTKSTSEFNEIQDMLKIGTFILLLALGTVLPTSMLSTGLICKTKQLDYEAKQPNSQADTTLNQDGMAAQAWPVS